MNSLLRPRSDTILHVSANCCAVQLGCSCFLESSVSVFSTLSTVGPLPASVSVFSL